MLLRNKRLIISNELSTKKNLYSVIIRRLASGGDAIQGRGHGEAERDFIPQFLSLLLANDMPPILPYDGATRKRTDAFSYTKSFVDNPSNEYELKKDTNLDNEMKTVLFQRCFIEILIKSYLEYQERGSVAIEPIEITESRNDWLGAEEETDYILRFQQEYKITNDAENFVKSDDISSWNTRTNGGTTYKKFINDLKNHCKKNSFSNVYSDKKMVGGKRATYWFGIESIVYELEEK